MTTVEDGGAPASAERPRVGDPAPEPARPPRPPRPETRIDLLGAVLGTTIAVVLYVVALSSDRLPPGEFAVVLFTAAPVFAFAALPMLSTRAHAHRDAAVNWFGVGLFGALVAMSYQLVGLPFVWPGGGPFGTSTNSTGALYLLFHLCLVVGAVCGAFGVSVRAWPWVLVAQAAVATAVALDLVPLPVLVHEDGGFTAVLTWIEWCTALLVLLAAALWSHRLGRSADVMRGLIVIALVLAFFEVALNALAGRRFDSIWWASLTMRSMVFGLLACGSAVVMARTLRRLDSYTERELDRSESELRQSLHVNTVLLGTAHQLTQALTPQQVAESAVGACARVTGLPRVAVMILHERSGGFEVLASTGYSTRETSLLARTTLTSVLPGPVAIRQGESVYCETRRELAEQFPDIASSEAHADVHCFAALPLRASEGSIGVIKISGPSSRTWTRIDRETLEGVALQVEESLERALLYEQARSAATTLQESLLPAQLPRVPGIELTARYRPGTMGAAVGGDWYDAFVAADGRIALTVGDVMGKGLDAAAQMGQLRTMLRALAAADPDPTTVVTRLDAAMEMRPEQIATFAYVLLDPAGDEAEIARVGHLPLIVVGHDGSARVLADGGSMPLGVPGAQRSHARVRLGDWAALVLYTDGLVERRDALLDAGIAAVLESASRAVTTSGGDTGRLADTILRECGGNDAEDDVCLLVAARPPR